MNMPVGSCAGMKENFVVFFPGLFKNNFRCYSSCKTFLILCLIICCGLVVPGIEDPFLIFKTVEPYINKGTAKFHSGRDLSISNNPVNGVGYAVVDWDEMLVGHFQ